MTRNRWPAPVVLFGLAAVGTVIGCLLHAIPDRPAARDWPVYCVLLLAPYCLTALAGRQSPGGWFTRAGAAVVCLAGLGLTAAAVSDTVSATRHGSAPAMPSSTLVAAAVLLVQYPAAVTTVVVSLIRSRTIPTAP